MMLFALVFLLRLLNVLETIGIIRMNLRSYRFSFVEALMLILIQIVNYFSLFKNLLLSYLRTWLYDMVVLWKSIVEIL